MRIAIITQGFARNENDFSGAAVFNNFVKELSLREGIDVTVFALYYPVGRNEYEFFNAKVFSFTKGSQSRTAKPGIWGRCKRKFAEEHSLRKFDVIHALWCGESGYIASQLSKTFGIRLAASICGGELAGIKSINYGSQLKFWKRYFVRKTFKQAKIIIAGSDYIIDKLEIYSDGKFSGKTKKISFGVDESLFCHPERRRRVSLIDGEIVIANIANAVPVKSHIDLLRAFGIVLQKFPQAKLMCCGHDNVGTLKKMVNDFNLNGSVEIKGFVDYKSLPAVLNDSDIFALSSLYESQNMALLEAAFCGLPVVSTNVGIAGEITSFTCEAGNYQQLAEKILYAISNYDKIKTDTETKINVLNQKYSVKACVDEYIKLYKAILIDGYK